MKTKVTAITLLFCFACFPLVGQEKPMFHVKSVHKETTAEHGDQPSEMVRYIQMIGTFQNKTYTVEAADAGWTEVFEVGDDYPATLKHSRLTGDGIVIESVYRGKPNKVSWRIVTIEER